MALALEVAGSGEDNQSATSPEKLRNSILTNGGIMQPIIMNELADGKHVCIEGNTRLYIYRRFLHDRVEGDWTSIPALYLWELQHKELKSAQGSRRLVYGAD